MDDERDLRAVRRGYWMRLARERAGMTLAAAAHAAGLGPRSGSTISRWESGERSPKVDQVERLADAYGVSVDLFTHPQPTDEERLEQLALGGTVAALADVAEAVAEAHDAGARPSSPRGRRQR